MPKAPRGAGPTTVAHATPPTTGTDPWSTPQDDPSQDGWPAGTARVPAVTELMADGAPAPGGPSESAGEAPVAQETSSEVEVIGGHQVVGVSPEEMVTGEPPAKKATATKKAAPAAKRATPTPVVAEHQGEMALGVETNRMQLAALDDVEEKVNALWYGPEGTAKTTDVCTAANHGRILVINAEGGLKTTPLRARGINTANISVFPPPGKPELLTEPNLERLFWQLAADLGNDPDSWYAVVWDSVTEIGTKLLRDVVVAEVAKNNALPEGSAKRKEHREDPSFTDRADYGVLSNRMLPLLRKYRDLPCHFLVTALERRDVDEDTGRVMYGPNTSPAVQTALMGYVDIALRVQNAASDEDVIPHFVARTRPARTTRAKDRFGVTPPVMADPTFERVLQYLNGDLVWDAEAEAAAQAAAHAANPAPAEPAKPPSGKRAPAKKATPAAAPAAATDQK